MSRTPIDILLQIAFLEEREGACGDYERFLMRKQVVRLCSPRTRCVLIRRLDDALKNAAPSNSPFATIGMYLLTVREAQLLTPRQISSRLGLTCRVYQLLERDHISPLRIPPECWRRVRKLCNLHPETLRGMIRHTHQLFCCRPSRTGTEPTGPGAHEAVTMSEYEIARVEKLLQSI